MMDHVSIFYNQWNWVKIPTQPVFESSKITTAEMVY